MRLAVKSSSSTVDTAVVMAAIVHMAGVIVSQPIIVMLWANPFVSLHGGAGGGGHGAMLGGKGGGGHGAQHSASLHAPVVHAYHSSFRYVMLPGHGFVPFPVYPAPEHVWRQQSDSAHTPLLRASLDMHTIPSPWNVAPAAHADWFAKPDSPHLAAQQSDCVHAPALRASADQHSSAALLWVVAGQADGSAKPDSRHVGVQQSDCKHTPALRASPDQHSAASLRTWVVAGQAVWSRKPDNPHVGVQHSEASPHRSPQSCPSWRSRAAAVAGHS